MSTSNPDYQPDRLIALLYEQYPQRTDVRRALQLCPAGEWFENDYLQFIGHSDTDNKTNGLRIAERLVLQDEFKGRIVVDLVADGRIAGINFTRNTG